MVYTYFIQHGEDGPIKVGQARDPSSRLRALQTGNPVRLYLRAVVRYEIMPEQGVHSHLASSRIHNEWFQLTDEVREVLDHAVELSRARENIDGVAFPESTTTFA